MLVTVMDGGRDEEQLAVNAMLSRFDGKMIRIRNWCSQQAALWDTAMEVVRELDAAF